MVATGDIIIISVKPEHARNIIVGRKTVELRRRFADTMGIAGRSTRRAYSPQRRTPRWWRGACPWVQAIPPPYS